MDPLISVIVPYWNAEPWIQRCVRSLARQKGNFQFILVNDGSDDESFKAAMAAYEEDDHRFVPISYAKRRGVSEARNEGLKAARGDWVTFLDADDEMQSETYDRFKLMLQEDPKAYIHQANHLRYYEKTKQLALRYTNPPGRYDIDNLPIRYPMVWNKLIYGAVARNVKFVPGLQFGEDEIYVLECLAKCRADGLEDYIHCSGEITVIKHFENKESLSHLYHKDEDALFRQANALMTFLQDHKDPEIRKMVLGVLAEHWGSKMYEKAFCKEG